MTTAANNLVLSLEEVSAAHLSEGFQREALIFLKSGQTIAIADPSPEFWEEIQGRLLEGRESGFAGGSMMIASTLPRTTEATSAPSEVAK